MAQKRTLPALAELSERIARSLGGKARMLRESEHDTAAAIAFDGRHLLLLRDHRWTVTVSLPTEHSWPMQTPAEWTAAEPEIRRALASAPRIVTLSDAIVALAASFPDLAPSFPGTPVPAEAWMKNAEDSVGLFQSERGVRVVVWIESSAAQQTVVDDARLAAIEAWLPAQLEKQRAARAAEEAEKKRRAALPVPEVADVLGLLRAGKRISTGSGRWNETYFVEEGRLRREVFDEGAVYVEDATEAALQKAIDFQPDRFREALGTLGKR